MAIYKMVGDKERLEPIRATSFVQEKIKEDPDLRHILRAQPEVMEEGLFILSEEFSGWHGSGRSIDLLGLDSSGRLVVIELKRTSTADHAELQALRYAAMVSVLTSEDIFEAHRSYMSKWGIDGDAEERIEAHLSGTDFDDIYTEAPRIVLVSEGFSKELTTSVLWLNENGLDITCIQLQPYFNGSELLLESSQVVPVPGTEELLVQAQDRRSENKKQRAALVSSVSFEESIETAPSVFKADTERVFKWAKSLEQRNLAVLRDTARVHANLRILTYEQQIALTKINFNQSDPKGPWLYLEASNLREFAPRTIPKLEHLSRRNLSIIQRPGVIYFSELSGELLTALTEAYREANGLLSSEAEPEA